MSILCFKGVLETLINSHRLSGTIQGYHEKAIFTPDIYSKTQTNYIDSTVQATGDKSSELRLLPFMAQINFGYCLFCLIAQYFPF